jgi:hypothetical protein
MSSGATMPYADDSREKDARRPGEEAARVEATLRQAAEEQALARQLKDRPPQR